MRSKENCPQLGNKNHRPATQFSRLEVQLLGDLMTVAEALLPRGAGPLLVLLEEGPPSQGERPSRQQRLFALAGLSLNQKATKACATGACTGESRKISPPVPQWPSEPFPLNRWIRWRTPSTAWRSRS